MRSSPAVRFIEYFVYALPLPPTSDSTPATASEYGMSPHTLEAMPTVNASQTLAMPR